MRYFTTDRDANSTTKLDRELLITGKGDLNPKERWLIAYLISYEQGSRIGTSQIVNNSGWSRRKVQRTLKSLEEKGYLYRDKDNWDAQTGPEIIVAERKGLLPNDD